MENEKEIHKMNDNEKQKLTKWFYENQDYEIIDAITIPENQDYERKCELCKDESDYFVQGTYFIQNIKKHPRSLLHYTTFILECNKCHAIKTIIINDECITQYNK